MKSMKPLNVFYYECPYTGKDIPIALDAIEDLARDQGDERSVEDMDDRSFFEYCEFILGV